jgi:hypothetical protein
MSDRPLPIGSLHAREFAPMRTQVPLSELRADGEGDVRFACKQCPRTEKIPLVDLQARFQPSEGLVNILNCILPDDCPRAGRNSSGLRECGFHYRDL